ncbi:hypothetical protein ACHQM5_004353 [Ranunculus cassubicifolius]
MASACVNNNVASLPDHPHRFFGSPSNSTSFDWFNPRSSPLPPRDSKQQSSSSSPVENLIDLEFSDEDAGDFEFRLEDPVNMMLPADELFFDGKLMPLHVSTARVSSSSSDEIRSVSVAVEEYHKSKLSSSISSGLDPYLFSPKAPRCSSGWRELLGLKRLQNSSKQENLPKSPTKSSSSLKHFMHRNPKTDSSLGLPLLKEKETESEIVTRDNNSDLPRISLDSHKLSCPNPKRNHHNHPPNIRLVRRNPDANPQSSSQTSSVSASTITTSSGNVRLVRRNQDSNTNSQTTGNALSVSMDSPRMNSSGKVVFQSLERSSSSPSTFNGGPRVKYKGMERRSYSANVKVSPVLNVPVCSLRGSSKFGLGQLFPSPHKRAGTVGSSSSNTELSSSTERNRSHHTNKQKSPSIS